MVPLNRDADFPGCVTTRLPALEPGMRLEEFDLMYGLEDRLWWYRGMRAITRALIDRYYPRGAGLRILDAGCGTGAMACLLADYGRVTGLDIEQHALRLAEARKQAALACASVTALPLPATAFDLVTCFDVLVMLDEPEETAALAEMRRVLAPGGRLVVRVAANNWLRGAHDRAWHIHRRYAAHELRAKLTQVGLVVDHVSYANTWLFPVAVAKRLSERLFPPDDHSELTYAFGPLDRVFGALLHREASLVARAGLPFGLSLFAVGRRGHGALAQ